MRPLAPLAATLLALFISPAALAADPDYDADGVVAGDCRPLDPAVHPGAADVPDLAFEDMNCDGIDGTPAGGIFVVPSGNDGNPGTRGQPVATLTKAIELAAAQGRDVYAAVGDYGRTVIAGASRNGIAIYGGYEAPAWTRTKNLHTTISGSPEAVFVQDATGIELQLLTLHGSPPAGAGATAYGLRAVRGVVALAGTKATADPGSAGVDQLAVTSAHTAPPQAAAGGVGQCGDVPGGGGNSTSWISTPRGGAGGRGGDSDDRPPNGLKGTDGSGSLKHDGTPIIGGVGGAGGTDFDPPNNVDGHVGNTGNPGEAGGHGAGGQNTAASAGEAWSGDPGDDGIDGTPGSAGGGGGGGSGRYGFDWGSGPGGGQGGHGGWPGTGGPGGGPGGGSFAVYAHDSTVVAVASTLIAGAGGRGGNGAAGQPGSAGGPGGIGRPGLDCGTTIGASGAGGQGGAGGNGGAGGGGAGGPSAAVFRAAGSHVSARSSTLTNGGGGTGGTGVNAGTPGGDDLVANGYLPGDYDGDGVADDADACPTAVSPAGCPTRPPKLRDSDGDGVPDPYEDDDGDGLRNGLDACPGEAAPGRADGCPVVVPPPFLPPVTPGGIGANVSREYLRNSKTGAIKFTRFKAVKLPAGSRVEVRCKGRKCPRKRWTKVGSGKIALKPFVGRWFPVRTVIEVRMTAPGTIGKVLRYRVARKALKKAELCLPPGVTTPQRC
jgi:hypothetical protein